MEGRHCQVACTGRCPLLRPGYYAELCDLTIAVVKTAIWRLGFGGDKNRKVALRFSCHPPVRFPLNDAALHDNAVMLLQGTCDDDCLAVYREAIAVLLEKNHHRSAFCDTICDVELLLWCALAISDYETLSTTLRSAKGALPKCILTSLLLRAIELYSDKAVEILLENGALPDVGLSVKGADRPLKRALELAEDDLNNSEDDDVADVDPVLVTKGIHLGKIVRTLVKFGANVLAPIDRHSDAIPLHKTVYFALHSDDLARAVIESTPPAGFSVEAYVGPDDTPYSPLASAIRDVASLSLNFSFSQPKLRRILRVAILPLLRGGSPMVPDPFEGQLVDGCLVTFLNQQNYAFLDLILAGREKASLNMANLRANLMAIAPLLPYDGGLGETIRRERFPFKLQAMCRLVILRRLSAVGLAQRQAAIEKLNLPRCLSSYLNFAEFDIC